MELSIFLFCSCLLASRGQVGLRRADVGEYATSELFFDSGRFSKNKAEDCISMACVEMGGGKSRQFAWSVLPKQANPPFFHNEQQDMASLYIIIVVII